MTNLRLDPELEQRVHRAAGVCGESLSEFIRVAARIRADQVLASEPDNDFSDVIGVVHSGGGRARQTGDSFTEGLAAGQTPISTAT